MFSRRSYGPLKKAINHALFHILFLGEARFVLLQHPSPWTFPFRIHFSPLRFSLIKYLLILLSYPYSPPFLFHEKLPFYVRSNGFSSNEWKHISLNRLVFFSHSFSKESHILTGKSPSTRAQIYPLSGTDESPSERIAYAKADDRSVCQSTDDSFFLPIAYLSLLRMIIPQIRVEISLSSLSPLLRILLPRNSLPED